MIFKASSNEAVAYNSNKATIHASLDSRICSFLTYGHIKINEAFASQYLAVERLLQLDPKITNRHGGAIAMGHPVGASGARILTHLTHQLAKCKNRPKRALAAACIGGGQGIAVCLESV